MKCLPSLTIWVSVSESRSAMISGQSSRSRARNPLFQFRLQHQREEAASQPISVPRKAFASANASEPISVPVEFRGCKAGLVNDRMSGPTTASGPSRQMWRRKLMSASEVLRKSRNITVTALALSCGNNHRLIP